MLVLTKRNNQKGLLKMFKATGQFISAEKDTYGNGCDPDSSLVSQYDETFTAPTLKELFENIASHFNVELKNISINECNNNTIIISRYENDNFCKPSKSTMVKWRKGLISLWLVDYSFKIEQINDVDFSKMSNEEIEKLIG
ncbi:MAG: hypothetical protein [Caudoviricetes sp.]|nr:MAG: hypothetical protein [Caudoviricetes sp.]